MTKFIDPKNAESKSVNQQTFIVRIWKTDSGDLRGYLIDPLTNITYPLIPSTEPHHEPENKVSRPTNKKDTCSGVIDTLSYRVGIWIENMVPKKTE